MWLWLCGFSQCNLGCGALVPGVLNANSALSSANCGTQGSALRGISQRGTDLAVGMCFILCCVVNHCLLLQYQAVADTPNHHRVTCTPGSAHCSSAAKSIEPGELGEMSSWGRKLQKKAFVTLI